jgi:hypothetical protein
MRKMAQTSPTMESAIDKGTPWVTKKLGFIWLGMNEKGNGWSRKV